MAKILSVFCLLLGLVIAQDTTKYPYHPHEHLEDLFHELETTDDSNHIIDEVLKHSFEKLDTDAVDLEDQEFDLRHLLPEGKGKLSQGQLTGVKLTLRKGDSQFYKKGDDITIQATILFPELGVNYEEASVEGKGVSLRGSLKGDYIQLLANLVISHHETEHTNKVDVFEVKGYRQSTFRYRKGDRSGRKISLTTNDVMEEIRMPLLKAVEKALRKTIEAHVLEWR